METMQKQLLSLLDCAEKVPEEDDAHLLTLWCTATEAVFSKSCKRSVRVSSTIMVGDDESSRYEVNTSSQNCVRRMLAEIQTKHPHSHSIRDFKEQMRNMELHFRKEDQALQYSQNAGTNGVMNDRKSDTPNRAEKDLKRKHCVADTNSSQKTETAADNDVPLKEDEQGGTTYQHKKKKSCIEETPSISVATIPYSTRNRNKTKTMPDKVRAALGLATLKPKKRTSLKSPGSIDTKKKTVERGTMLSRGNVSPARRSLRNKSCEVQTQTRDHDNEPTTGNSMVADRTSPEKPGYTPVDVITFDVVVDPSLGELFPQMSPKHEMEGCTENISSEKSDSKIYNSLCDFGAGNKEGDGYEFNPKINKVSPVNAPEGLQSNTSGVGKSKESSKSKNDQFYCMICNDDKTLLKSSKEKSAVYASKSKLTGHIFDDHSSQLGSTNSITCTECNKTFRSSAAKADRMFIYRYLNHMEFSHKCEYYELNQPTLQKKQTKYGTETRLNWVSSTKQHDLLFVCMFCNNINEMLKGCEGGDYKHYTSRANLREHIENTHIKKDRNILKLNCPICGVSAKTSRSFEFVNQIVNRILHHLEDKHDFSYFVSKKSKIASEKGLVSLAEAADKFIQSEDESNMTSKKHMTTADHEYPIRENKNKDVGTEIDNELEAAEGYSEYPDSSLIWPCLHCSDGNQMWDSKRGLCTHLSNHVISEDSMREMVCVKCAWKGCSAGKAVAELNFIDHCILMHGILSDQKNTMNSDGSELHITESDTMKPGESLNIIKTTLYSCFICMSNNVEFETLKGLTDHVEDEHVVDAAQHKLLKCHLCVCYFASSSTVEGDLLAMMDKALLHMVKVHGAAVPSYSKVLMCDGCGFQTLSHQGLSIHITHCHNTGTGTQEGDANPQASINMEEPSHAPGLCHSQAVDFEAGNMKTRIDETTSPVLIYKCPLCTKRFSNGRNLDTHVKRVHQKIKAILCTVCDKSFFTKQEWHVHAWLNHKLNLTNQDLVICVICGEQMIRKLLAVHFRKHDSQEQDCEECGQKVIGQANLKSHMKKHMSAKETVVCTECGITLSSSAGLYKHRLRVHRANSHRCSLCKYVGCSVDALNKHALEQHPDGKAGFSCQMCQRQLSDKAAYQNHMFAAHQANISSRPVVSCPVCHFQTLGNALMRKHMQSHQATSAQFACDVCGKEFKNKLLRRDHMRRMHGKKKYSCQDCEKNFSEKIFLLRHIARNHKTSADVICCRLCPYVTTKLPLLHAHIQRAHFSADKKQPESAISEMNNSTQLIPYISAVDNPVAMETSPAAGHVGSSEIVISEDNEAVYTDSEVFIVPDLDALTGCTALSSQFSDSMDAEVVQIIQVVEDSTQSSDSYMHMDNPVATMAESTYVISDSVAGSEGVLCLGNTTEIGTLIESELQTANPQEAIP